MSKKDMTIKIQSLIDKSSVIDEDQVRSLMILIRKQLELMNDSDVAQFLTLNLFCNWSAHIEITQSMTGLRTLAKINDTLVKVKKLTDTKAIQTEMSNAIGFKTLQGELVAFLSKIEVKEDFTQEENWKGFLTNLIEIIKDVPIAFPPPGKLNKSQQKIYTQIVSGPIKLGAGVIMITLSRVDYEKLGVPNGKEFICLLIRTEDTTTLVVPLLIAI